MAQFPLPSREWFDFLILQQKVVWVTLIALAASFTAVGAEDNVDRGAGFSPRIAPDVTGGEARATDLIWSKLQSAVSPDDWTDKESNQGLTDSFIVAMITKGGKANGKSRIMPAFGDKLNTEQVQDLLAFIRSLPK